MIGAGVWQSRAAVSFATARSLQLVHARVGRRHFGAGGRARRASGRSKAAAIEPEPRPADEMALSSKEDHQFPERRQQRRVRFDLMSTQVHEIVPYCETYGLHPREFVFDKSYGMVPARGPHGFNGYSAHGDTEVDDSDDEWDCDDFDEVEIITTTFHC